MITCLMAPNRWKSWDVWLHNEDAVGSNVARVDNRVDEHVAALFEVEFPVRYVTPKIVYPRPNSKVSANDFISVHAAGSRFAKGNEELQWWLNGELIATGASVKFPSGKPGSINLTLRSPQTGLTDDTTIIVFKDDDLDGMPNEWEIDYGLNPLDPSDKGSDEDNDGLIALDEYLSGASPIKIDTDNDNYSDDVEHRIGSNPNDPESLPNLQFNGTPAPQINPKDCC